MDCYIVRIYRRMNNKNGGINEAVGLVEQVQKGENKMAFSSYADLVRLLQENGKGKAVATDRALMELIDDHANLSMPGQTKN